MSRFIPVLILAPIAATLIWAGLYALFGKPRSQKGKKRRQEVINGFRLAGGILLGLGLMVCVVGGAGTSLGTMQGTRFSRLGKLGSGALALASFALIAAMVQRWAKYFAGWIVYSVVNALIMASTGHLLNNPAIPVSRTAALIMAGLFTLQVWTTKHFTKDYKLHSIEKVALLLWVLGFTWAVLSPRFAVLSMSIASAALGAAWWHRRRKRYGFRHARSDDSSSRSLPV